MTEFWQRWHMTLGRQPQWQAGYLPQSVDRLPAKRPVAWCGVYLHPVGRRSWRFILWGAGHGLLLVAERAGVLKTERLRLSSLPVFLMVTLLWIPFRASDLGQVKLFGGALFGLDSAIPLWIDGNRVLANPKISFLLFVAGCICLVPDWRFQRLRLRVFRKTAVVAAFSCAVLILACLSVAENGLNPFIYFQF